jgi:hypothetical protein
LFDPSQGEIAALHHLANPMIDPTDLTTIAGAFPALASQVASHPQLYPDLANWLCQLGRPDVNAALAARTQFPEPPPRCRPPHRRLNRGSGLMARTGHIRRLRGVTSPPTPLSANVGHWSPPVPPSAPF